MPAGRRQLLPSFWQCLWRPRLGRLYVQTHDRLQRCPAGSALYRDATGLCRKILSTIGGGLIDATRYLLLTGGDIGGGLVGVVGHLLVIGDDPGGDLVNAAQYQLVTRDEPVDALPHRVEHCIKLLLIERGGWCGQAAYAGGVLPGW
jgi:hypothetical protein